MKHLGTVILLAVVGIAVAGSAAAAERRDSIADLDALAAQHSWLELGAHLMDIPPAARDAHWQALVEQAAVGEVAPLAAAAGSFVDKLVVLERYYPTFPSLAQSSEFMKLRATVGLDAFRRCFELAAEQYLDPAPCRDHLDAFARAEPVDLTVAKGAAELVAQRGNDAAAARFYAIMLAAGDDVCQAASVAKAAVAALREPVESFDA